MSDSDEQVCPLCCEELDISDQNFLPCKCGYHGQAYDGGVRGENSWRVRPKTFRGVARARAAAGASSATPGAPRAGLPKALKAGDP